MRTDRFIHKLVNASAFVLLTCLAELGAAQSRPSPPGELIDVAGHKVHLYCTGHGAPTVVVASGGFSFDWGLVQPRVSQWTRICTYDPAGTAWSDRVEGKDHPTCTDRVNELHELLWNARIDGPYVIVGFSIGGLVARLYATRYPADIAGMVLVDHAFIDTGGSDTAPSTQGSLSTAGLDSPPVLISKTPIVLDLEDDRNFSKLPQRDQELHRWALSIHSIRPTPEDAAICFSEVDRSESKQAFPLGDTPLAVISTLYASKQYTQLQHALLMLSRNSKQFVAENSTHMVIIDEPEIVTEAIHEVVDAVKGHRPMQK